MSETYYQEYFRAVCEGENAFEAGLARESNPHAAGKLAHDGWDDGWLHCWAKVHYEERELDVKRVGR